MLTQEGKTSFADVRAFRPVQAEVTWKSMSSLTWAVQAWLTEVILCLLWTVKHGVAIATVETADRNVR